MGEIWSFDVWTFPFFLQAEPGSAPHSKPRAEPGSACSSRSYIWQAQNLTPSIFFSSQHRIFFFLFSFHIFFEKRLVVVCSSADFARGHGFPRGTSSSTNAPTYFRPLAFPTTSFYAVMRTLEEENALFLPSFPLIAFLSAKGVKKMRERIKRKSPRDSISASMRVFCSR